VRNKGAAAADGAAVAAVEGQRLRAHINTVRNLGCEQQIHDPAHALSTRQ
jgi:hypothetical protein